MDRRQRLRILTLGMVLLGSTAAAAYAGSPWEGLLTFNSVEADPDKVYTLSEENGPWMIMACSFSGEGATEQAQQLVLELRKKYKLPAYMHQAKFEFGETQGLGVNPYGEPLRMKHRLDELEEVAVLVGNYSSVNDPEAQGTLRRIKTLRPKALEPSELERTNQTLVGLRMAVQAVQEAVDSDKKGKGLMGHAFVTTNPVLPKEYFNNPGIDPLVLEMNRDVQHSLLDCPGKYTIKVATFRGAEFIKSEEIEEIEQGKQIESKLVEAADKAHRLTEALRLKGWEAYEFHDRYSSIVTVGSFDSLGTPRPDGKTEIDPRIYAIFQQFKAEQTPLSAPIGVLPTQVKTLMGIPFDIQPMPVEVPRRSIAQEMALRR